MRALTAFWKFSRPHTVIGSAVSIITLYIILCADRERYLYLLLPALITGIATNIFIVGLNQIADVEIDKINKPWLPIPAGELSVSQAKKIAFTCLGISLVISLCMSLFFFFLIVLASLIGWAYSMPPFHLKKHHMSAAVAISLVRGLIINLGGFVVFSSLVDRNAQLPDNLKVLTFFITLFGVVIAWFKDLPDTEGDAKFNVKTIAVLYSPKTALIAGNVLIVSVYVFIICVYAVAGLKTDLFQTRLLLYGHLAFLILFIENSCSIKLNDKKSIKTFYHRFWIFFFAEYVLYSVAYW
ncbi:MAG: 4-hydroxybenzoate polyprenyltransferase-like prenyltransferase [Bacteroidetes bacterium]|nr:4-hydroxybenzoate polyprenyltransferase-like prenyltransferase [Bacteroidota bacterium]